MYKYILFIFAAYIYIYNPVFRILPSVDTLMLLYPMVFFLAKKQYMQGLQSYKNININWLVLFLFIIFRSLLLDGDDILISWVGFFIETILLTYILSVLMADNNISIVRILLLTSSLAASISCACLLNPTFDMYIRMLQIDYSVLSTEVIFRSYGLAQGLNFEYGIIQGLIFGIGLFYLKENKWYIFFIPLVIMSILINARTGILVIVLAAFFYFIKNFSYQIFSFIVISFLCLVYLYQYLENFIPYDTYIWIDGFFSEVNDIILGTNKAENDTLGTLLNSLVFPTTVQSWIIGSGHTLFGNQIGPSSDVGYINQLAYGGLIYLFLLLKLSYNMLKKGYPYMDKILFLFIIVALLLANFKGGIFGTNGGAFKVVVLFSFVLFQTHQNKNISRIQR